MPRRCAVSALQLAGLFGLSLLLACGGAAPSPDADRPAGNLLIVGGGHQPDALVETFVGLAGGPDSARIAVIPLASSAPEESGAGKVEQLVEFGADAFVLIPSREEAEAETAPALLDGATGIWFTGGSQSRITSVLTGTRLADAIRARFHEGAVIGGTSAGAAIMSDSMITGSQYLPDVDTVGYYGDEFPRVARRTIEIVPGLGFLHGAIVDQHFLQRERHNRLISAVFERPSMIGVGIDESTGILVEPDGRWTVIGESAAVVYDARDAEITSADARVLGAAGVRTHVLPSGATFDPATGTARLPIEPASMAEAESDRAGT